MKCKYCNFENNPKEKICQYCGLYLKIPAYTKHIIIFSVILGISQHVPEKFEFPLIYLSLICGVIGFIQHSIETIKIKEIRRKNKIDIEKILDLYFQKTALTKGIIVNFIKAEGNSQIKLMNNEDAILSLENECLNIMQNNETSSIPLATIKKIDFYNEEKNVFFKIYGNNDAEYTFHERDKDYKYLFCLEENFGIEINNYLTVK